MSPSGPKPGGLGAARLAQRLTRVLVATRPPGWKLWALDFGIRDGAAARADKAVLDAAAAYVVNVDRRAPGALVLLALDRQPETLVWHLHGIGVVPPNVSSVKLRRWFIRFFPRDPATRRRRAALSAQRCVPLSAARLESRLVHDIGAHLRGAPGLPPIQARVLVTTAAAPLWSAVLTPGGPSAPSAPPRATQCTPAPPNPLAPNPRRRVVSTDASPCGWCGRSVRGERAGSRWHPRCRKPALNTFARARASQGAPWYGVDAARWWRSRVEPWLRVLPRLGYHGRDALRVALYLARRDESPSARRCAGWRARLDAVLRCPPPCGRPLGKRLDATMCGRGACRMRRARGRSTGAPSP